jgi:hypothetical protein
MDISETLSGIPRNLMFTRNKCMPCSVAVWQKHPRRQRVREKELVSLPGDFREDPVETYLY